MCSVLMLVSSVFYSVIILGHIRELKINVLFTARIGMRC